MARALVMHWVCLGQCVLFAVTTLIGHFYLQRLMPKLDKTLRLLIVLIYFAFVCRICFDIICIKIDETPNSNASETLRQLNFLVVAQSLFQGSDFLFNFVFNIVIAKVFSLLLAFQKRSMAEVQLFLQKSSNVIFWTMLFWIVIVQTPYIYFYCCFIVDREDARVQ